MLNLPNLGVRPKHAEIWSVNAERITQIIVPPKPRPETAEKAIKAGVIRWIEGLDSKLHLQIMGEVTVVGPFLCPFMENYGEDMYLARARFRSTKPRLVPEDVVVANRRLSEEAGYTYEEFRGAEEGALPADWLSQLQFVGENPDRVYGDLRELERMKSDPDIDQEL